MGLVKLIGTHPEDLASGRVVAPEEVFDRDALDMQSAHDKRLVDDGLIIDAKITPVALEGEALQERARELNIEGRTTMSATKLRRAVAEAEARDATDDATGGNA